MTSLEQTQLAEKLNKESNVKWFRNDCNNNVAIDYDISENSTVIDLGGYQGLWADMIIAKYNPYMILVEPIPVFYENLKNKYQHNPKVSVLNFGISTHKHSGVLYLNGDGTSKFITTSTPINVEFITITDLLTKINKNSVDLIQINIEGEEYPLLEKMLEEGSIHFFKNIQIQYHSYVENCIERRGMIQNKMLEFFKEKYNYPFVFEGWTRK